MRWRNSLTEPISSSSFGKHEPFSKLARHLFIYLYCLAGLGHRPPTTGRRHPACRCSTLWLRAAAAIPRCTLKQQRRLLWSLTAWFIASITNSLEKAHILQSCVTIVSSPLHRALINPQPPPQVDTIRYMGTDICTSICKKS